MHIDHLEAYHVDMKYTACIIAEHGGKMIAGDGVVETLEGPDETGRVVVFGYPELDWQEALAACREGSHD